jgi:hypothetical protein
MRAGKLTPARSISVAKVVAKLVRDDAGEEAPGMTDQVQGRLHKFNWRTEQIRSTAPLLKTDALDSFN